MPKSRMQRNVIGYLAPVPKQQQSAKLEFEEEQRLMPKAAQHLAADADALGGVRLIALTAPELIAARILKAARRGLRRVAQGQHLVLSRRRTAPAPEMAVVAPGKRQLRQIEEQYEEQAQRGGSFGQWPVPVYKQSQYARHKEQRIASGQGGKRTKQRQQQPVCSPVFLVCLQHIIKDKRHPEALQDLKQQVRRIKDMELRDCQQQCGQTAGAASVKLCRAKPNQPERGAAHKQLRGNHRPGGAARRQDI